MSTGLTDASHREVKVEYRMPVGLSGFRDHRPLFAPVRTRARWKWRSKTVGQSTVRERVCRLLQEWERAARKGEVPPSVEEPLCLRL